MEYHANVVGIMWSKHNTNIFNNAIDSNDDYDVDNDNVEDNTVDFVDYNFNNDNDNDDDDDKSSSKNVFSPYFWWSLRFFNWTNRFPLADQIRHPTDLWRPKNIIYSLDLYQP